MFFGVNYPVSMTEALCSIPLFSSQTATMDWFVPSLVSLFGLFSLRCFCLLLVCPTSLLPPGSHMAHLPLLKCPSFFAERLYPAYYCRIQHPPLSLESLAIPYSVSTQFPPFL